MKRARFAVGAAWGLLVATASVGCASHEAAVSRAALAATGSTYTTLEGVWEGKVWEIPSDYIQGVRRIAVKVSSAGSWTASTGGAICATGSAAVRDGLVILDGHTPPTRLTRSSPPRCAPLLGSIDNEYWPSN